MMKINKFCIFTLAVSLAVVLCPGAGDAQAMISFDLDRNLSLSRTGDDIKFMQEYLHETYPDVTATGRFDISTRNAVIRFQETYTKEVLTPWRLTKGTGFVGTTTRAKMNEILGQDRIFPTHTFSEVLVKVKSGQDINTVRQDIISLTGKEPLEISRISDSSLFSNTYRVSFDRSVLTSDIIQKYGASEDIEYVEPNFIAAVQTTTPNDTYYSTTGAFGQKSFKDQWGMYTIKAGEAWDIEKGSKDVIVAVVDSGVDIFHTDLSANIWKNPGEIAGNGKDDDNNGYIDDTAGWDFFYNDNNPDDEYGHGTHCAGIIAAMTNNNKGVAGVSWNSKIMAVRAMDSQGLAPASVVASAIEYAVDNGADVINSSFRLIGNITSIKIFDTVLDYAYDKGCVVVVAAGNEDKDASFTYPGNYPTTISVAGISPFNKKTESSNYGKTVDISAPGVGILSLRAQGTDIYKDGKSIVDEKYYLASGTSMAAPFVSGVAALILSQNPGISNEQVKLALKETAYDPGSTQPTQPTQPTTNPTNPTNTTYAADTTSM
jgi:subtilisin family serine protease